MVYPAKKTISTPRRMKVSYRIAVELPKEGQISLFSCWTKRSVIFSNTFADSMIEFVRKTEDSFLLSKFCSILREHIFLFFNYFWKLLFIVQED